MILQTLGITKSVEGLKPYIDFNGETNRKGMKKGLNNLQNRHTYQITYADQGTDPRDARAFLLKTAFEDLRYGVAIAFSKGSLPNYPHSVDHWVAVAGIDDNNLLIVDPTAQLPGWRNVQPTRWINVNQILIKAIVA